MKFKKGQYLLFFSTILLFLLLLNNIKIVKCDATYTLSTDSNNPAEIAIDTTYKTADDFFWEANGTIYHEILLQQNKYYLLSVAEIENRDNFLIKLVEKLGETIFSLQLTDRFGVVFKVEDDGYYEISIEERSEWKLTVSKDSDILGVFEIPLIDVGEDPPYKDWVDDCYKICQIDVPTGKYIHSYYPTPLSFFHEDFVNPFEIIGEHDSLKTTSDEFSSGLYFFYTSGSLGGVDLREQDTPIGIPSYPLLMICLISMSIASYLILNTVFGKSFTLKKNRNDEKV